MTGKTQFYDEKAHFIFEGRDIIYDSAHINEIYEVAGRTLHQETHSYLDFKYGFCTLEEANEYLNRIKESYPLSIITVYKKTWQQCRFYG